MNEIHEITTSNEFIELGKKQAQLFMNDNIAYMNCLVQSRAQRVIMVDAYNALVNKKMIPRIEELPENVKSDLWKSSVEFAGGKLDRDNGIALAKSLYVLEYFLNSI